MSCCSSRRANAPAADDATLRAFLLRVLETIQWHAKKKYLARPIRKVATKRVLFCALVAFLFILAPYLIVGTMGAEGISKAWSLFALHSAIASGLLGACFSRLISVQRNWSEMTLDEVFLHREWSYTLLRASAGVCGALIVYFFLRSEFMSGAMFPDFAQVSMRYVQVDAQKSVGMTFVMPSKDLALLDILVLHRRIFRGAGSWAAGELRAAVPAGKRCAQGQIIHTALQLPADQHLPTSINAVNLKDRLRDIKTNCGDRLHARLFRIVRASTAPTSVALTRR